MEDFDNEVLDIESELAKFEEEWQDEEETETTETETEEETEEEETEEQGEEQKADPNNEDEHKRNQAFAEMRKQLEESRKYAEFIKQLAQEGGVAPEELLARYQERKLEAEAQKQQVPVEFLKESRETKTELTQLKEQLRAERFNAQVESVSSKYGADESTIRAAMQYMMETGIDPRVHDNFDFEKFYRAANLDTIIQKEVETARQKDLEDKKKRQENASIGNGNSVSPSSGSEWSDEDFDAELNRLGLRI